MNKYRYIGKTLSGKLFQEIFTLFEIENGKVFKWQKKNNIVPSSCKKEQYTGLKDKNGKEIYEGDIIKVPVKINNDYHGNYSLYEIKIKACQILKIFVSSEKGKLPRGYIAGFIYDYLEFDRKLFLFSDDYLPNCENIEVIGNIHECLHKKLTLKDWECNKIKDESYTLQCPDCQEFVHFEEIEERDRG